MTTPLTAPRAARLTFTAPPPGFAPLTEFDLAEVDGAAGLYTLRDAAGAGLRLFLLDPAVYLPDYLPSIDDAELAALGAATAADLDVYVVATIQQGGPVVNLLAPVLVNPVSAAAVQLILEEDWPLQAELAAPAA